MKRIEIEVMSSNAALNSFTETGKKVQTGKKVVPRLAFGSLKELFSAITQKRLELVRYVASHCELNTRQLAQQLGRDYKNVHNDVSALVELGLLDKNKKGVLGAPFDEIVIHAPVRDAA
ncbi:MAG: hypothetical protein RL120_08445 [Gammaproteobacteria bacterium]